MEEIGHIYKDMALYTYPTVAIIVNLGMSKLSNHSQT